MTKEVPSLDYCALHYLNQWLEHDQRYRIALHSGDESMQQEALKKATTFYKVARCFPKKPEKSTKTIDRRLLPALDILLNGQPRSRSHAGYIAAVVDTEKELGKAYKMDKRKKTTNSVLSATTKLMWLAYGSPIAIYDSYARMAISAPEGCYPSYFKAWRNAYSTNKDDVIAACTKLTRAAEFVFARKDTREMTRQMIESYSGKLFFRERVFDIYLWYVGYSGARLDGKTIVPR